MVFTSIDWPQYKNNVCLMVALLQLLRNRMYQILYRYKIFHTFDHKLPSPYEPTQISRSSYVYFLAFFRITEMRLKRLAQALFLLTHPEALVTISVLGIKQT